MFSFAVSVQIMAIFLLALISVYAVSVSGNHNLRDKLADQKKLNQQRLIQLTGISNELAKQKGNAGQSRLMQLQRELEAERYLLDVLGAVYASHRKGFAGYLESFSRRVVDGLWISRFDMLDGGASLKLVGGAIKPDAVPRFIENLKQEAILQGTKFQALEIDRSDAKKGWVDFSLASDGYSKSPFDIEQ